MDTLEQKTMIDNIKEYQSQGIIWDAIVNISNNHPASNSKHSIGEIVYIVDSGISFSVLDSCTVKNCNVYFLCSKENQAYQLYAPEIILK